MPDLRFCTYCSKHRPTESFVRIVTGKGSRIRVKYKCELCAKGSALSPAERDAAGRAMTAERKLARSNALKH